MQSAKNLLRKGVGKKKKGSFANYGDDKILRYTLEINSEIHFCLFVSNCSYNPIEANIETFQQIFSPK
jgi:hypothetical protein